MDINSFDFEMVLDSFAASFSSGYFGAETDCDGNPVNAEGSQLGYPECDRIQLPITTKDDSHLLLSENVSRTAFEMSHCETANWPHVIYTDATKLNDVVGDSQSEFNSADTRENFPTVQNNYFDELDDTYMSLDLCELGEIAEMADLLQPFDKSESSQHGNFRETATNEILRLQDKENALLLSSEGRKVHDDLLVEYCLTQPRIPQESAQTLSQINETEEASCSWNINFCTELQMSSFARVADYFHGFDSLHSNQKSITLSNSNGYYTSEMSGEAAMCCSSLNPSCGNYCNQKPIINSCLDEKSESDTMWSVNVGDGSIRRAAIRGLEDHRYSSRSKVVSLNSNGKCGPSRRNYRLYNGFKKPIDIYCSKKSDIPLPPSFLEVLLRATKPFNPNNGSNVILAHEEDVAAADEIV